MGCDGLVPNWTRAVATSLSEGGSRSVLVGEDGSGTRVVVEFLSEGGRCSNTSLSGGGSCSV